MQNSQESIHIFDYGNARYNGFGPEEYLEHQARVHGLDIEEFHHLMRRWFEEEALLSFLVPGYDALRREEEFDGRSGLSGADKEAIEKEVEHARHLVDRVEDFIREELFEHAQTLDATRARSVHTIAGFIAALKVVSNKDQYNIDEERMLHE